ncbi:MAG: DUF1080 domain-containing protein, partial [Planctomycetaceae bacterium]|nr:DUF1080 domain-containing protein [Planctomycetaceae bacterium]
RVTAKQDGQVEITGKADEIVKEDLSKWNTIEISCVGNTLVHKINGKVTVVVTDNDEKNREAKGLLALQIHAGSPMTIQFKDLQIRSQSKKK